ncbi:MAG: metal ABC transporter solute-binding protein, Zn/Mn family [Acidimicrobiales bacterium]
MRTVLGSVMAVAAVVALAPGCGDDADDGGAEGRPNVVVTTSILGDVVRELVGDDADVEVVIPPGADPHDLAPSPQQVEAMLDAGLLIVNGGGLEHGLEDTIESAIEAGAEVVVAVPAGADDHFFSDPLLMRDAVATIERALAAHTDLDRDSLAARAADYTRQLEEVSEAIERILAPIPPERRVLVTNHDTLASFAARLGFEVLEPVHPGGSTLSEPSAADMAALADEIRARSIPAVFTDASSSSEVVEVLGAEGVNVEVVPLHTESLGPPGSGAETYLELVRSNATAIAEALA